VQGVDVWINTPRRPWEACSTSGMKVLVNGGINLSELDGWWAEAYTPEVGWAIGDMQEHGEDTGWDAAEAEALYTLLEQKIVPAFYERGANGIPEKWIKKMRNSMATLTPKYSANRMVREYTEKYYLPSAEKYIQRASDKGAVGKRIMNTANELNTKWNGIHFNEVKADATNDEYNFSANIFLNGINTKKVLVELYADGKSNDNAERIPMQLQSFDNGDTIFKDEVNTTRSPDDYTIRIIANYENISVPLENDLILWQR
jgi:starch phosphorylase